MLVLVLVSANSTKKAVADHSSVKEQMKERQEIEKSTGLFCLFPLVL